MAFDPYGHGRSRWARERHRTYPKADRPAQEALEAVRIGKLLRRAGYLNWQFFPDRLRGGGPGFSAFRSDPERPSKLQKLGPWPLPKVAGLDEVEAATRAAVVAAVGERAAGNFRFRRDGK